MGAYAENVTNGDKFPYAIVSGALQGTKPAQQIQPKKSSFFGFRRNKEESDRARLDKKRSSMF